jgi:Zn-dependent alcohol dehydrogenase
VTGRQWKGTAFGGWKARQDVPKLVNKVILGELNIDDFITHNFDSLDDVNKSIDALHSGDCLRAVVKISQVPQIE